MPPQAVAFPGLVVRAGFVLFMCVYAVVLRPSVGGRRDVKCAVCVHAPHLVSVHDSSNQTNTHTRTDALHPAAPSLQLPGRRICRALPVLQHSDSPRLVPPDADGRERLRVQPHGDRARDLLPLRPAAAPAPVAARAGTMRVCAMQGMSMEWAVCFLNLDPTTNEKTNKQNSPRPSWSPPRTRRRRRRRRRPTLTTTASRASPSSPTQWRIRRESWAAPRSRRRTATRSRRPSEFGG